MVLVPMSSNTTPSAPSPTPPGWLVSRFCFECTREAFPKIRDEILGDAAALGGKGFSAHFGQCNGWLVSRQPALREIFARRLGFSRVSDTVSARHQRASGQEACDARPDHTNGLRAVLAPQWCACRLYIQLRKGGSSVIGMSRSFQTYDFGGFRVLVQARALKAD
jgi:hypothetical protein